MREVSEVSELFHSLVLTFCCLWNAATRKYQDSHLEKKFCWILYKNCWKSSSYI